MLTLWMDSRLLLVKLFGTTFLFDDALSTPWIFTTFARFLSNNKRCFDELLLTITGSIAVRHTQSCSLPFLYNWHGCPQKHHKIWLLSPFLWHSVKIYEFFWYSNFYWNWFWQMKNTKNHFDHFSGSEISI